MEKNLPLNKLELFLRTMAKAKGIDPDDPQKQLSETGLDNRRTVQGSGIDRTDYTTEEFGEQKKNERTE